MAEDMRTAALWPPFLSGGQSTEKFDRKVLKGGFGLVRRIVRLEQTFDSVIQLFGPERLDDPIPSLLELLGAALECDWATYWKVDSSSYVLQPAATWHKVGVCTESLERDTKGRSLSLSEGTAGHVWRSRKPVWTTNLVKDMCLPRSLDAEEAGLRGGIWLPVKTESTVYAVLEFLGTALPPTSEEMLLALEVFGIKLGNLINEGPAQVQ